MLVKKSSWQSRMLREPPLTPTLAHTTCQSTNLMKVRQCKKELTVHLRHLRQREQDVSTIATASWQSFSH